MSAQQVQPILVEPLSIDHGASQKGTHHVVQAGSISCKAAGRQPYQSNIPAVRLRHPSHQSAENPSHWHEQQQEGCLGSDPLPVKQDHREYGPDRQIVKAGVAQHALTQWLAQNTELLQQQNQDRQRRHGT